MIRALHRVASLLVAQVQVFAGVVEMPEARSQEAPEKTAKGFEATARVGAADWLTLQAKFWQDISDNLPKVNRYGMSVSTIVAQAGDLGGTRIGLMPTATFQERERISHSRRRASILTRNRFSYTYSSRRSEQERRDESVRGSRDCRNST